ncbi:hypothetical protein AMEX_G9668 [Astyanax mexicanus]|uniref:Uncharacterized protein n=1 Tax=Astyanax mexicanus TaxID=7994 RepID=A0A8T2LTE7_ASTMX|nr:hypothetical protein AMEX_G9668 [Astyanax mexicanus]
MGYSLDTYIITYKAVPRVQLKAKLMHQFMPRCVSEGDSFTQKKLRPLGLSPSTHTDRTQQGHTADTPGTTYIVVWMTHPSDTPTHTYSTVPSTQESQQ